MNHIIVKIVNFKDAVGGQRIKELISANPISSSFLESEFNLKQNNRFDLLITTIDMPCLMHCACSSKKYYSK